jgi:methionyl-tRNA synthetase
MCDVIARGKKMRGYDVFFLTGLDEHGEKIQKNAEAKGVTPQQFVDEISVRFTSLWDAMEIKYSDFIRTTQPRHEKTVQKIHALVQERSSIYNKIRRATEPVKTELKEQAKAISQQIAPLRKELKCADRIWERSLDTVTNLLNQERQMETQVMKRYKERSYER